MTILGRETGTFRASSGTLIHSRVFPDGRIVLEPEDGARVRGDEELVKLSDDPNWPDIDRGPAGGQLLVD